MRIGFAIPNIGPIGTLSAVKAVAERAEALGYQSLWTIERLLYPVNPRAPYPATPDGKLPDPYKYVLDPLDVLTFAAAHTSTVTLGTSVLDIPYYNPVTLARRLTTIDILSNGRLCVGLGLGWSPDEMQATGADMKKRGAMADEFIEVLKAIWTTNPAEYKGKFFQVPASYISQKPVQRPHPPILLAAFAPPAMQRLAKMADGWNPVGIPAPVIAQMFGGLKEMAKAAGRDPSKLKLVVRANVEVSPTPLGDKRFPFSGTLEQIKEDIAAHRDIGAHVLFFDPVFSPGAQELPNWLSLMEQLRKLAD